MHVQLILHLFRQLARGKRLVGLVALASVAGVVAWLSALDTGSGRAGTVYHEVVANAAGPTLAIATLVLGAATMRDERDGGTLPYLYLQPIGRWRFAFSAWIAGAGAALVVSLAGWLVSWLGAWATTGSAVHAVPAISVYAASAVGYSALFLPLGYLFSRAILIGLGFVFVWEGIITTFVSGLAAASVWRTAVSIYAGLVELPSGALEALGPVQPGVWGGLAKVLATVAFGVTLLAWAVKYRDAL